MKTTRYFVERRCFDPHPIWCESAEEAIETAKTHRGTAWEHTVYRDRNGLPVNEFRKYDADLMAWVH